MQAQTAAALTPIRAIRALPIVPLNPSVISVVPGAIADAATKVAVDAKFNAALKQQITQVIGSSDPAVTALVNGLALDYNALAGDTVLSVIQKVVVPVMSKQPALAALATALQQRQDRAGAPTVATLLNTNVPLAQNPLFTDDVRQGKGRELLRIANLDPNLIEKIDSGGKKLEAWNTFDWDNAVKQNILTLAQRDSLSFATDLSRLTGEQYALVDAANKAGLNTASDLIRWDKSHWLDLIRKNSASVPDGIAPEAYADQLTKTVQQTFPSEYFSYRIADKTLAQNASLAFRHLDLTNGAGRVDALSLFLQNNSAEDLRFVNLLDNQPASDGALNWTGIAAADQQPVQNQVLAYQRVLHLAPDYDSAMSLLGAGLDSSPAIAGLSYSTFKAKTGLDDASAAPIYADAQFRSAQITHGVQLTKDAISAIEKGRLFQGIDPSFVNDLKDVPGYVELFGDTSYCDCADCRSIFSPAAYFADLMYFIETNITDKAFAGKPKHALRLDMRRPDLWKLKLTCENTDTLIPHLTLVNEILSSYITQTLSVADVAQTLAGDRTAIGLPFHAPLETVREYLRDWSTDLRSVYEVLNASSDALIKETLRLSDDEWNALIAAPADTAWIHFESSDHTQMDVVQFLPFSSIARAQLDELQQAKTTGGFNIVRIKLSDDIQSEKEVVQGLSEALLDRIGRFLRLARKTGLSLTELDEILQSVRITDSNPFSAKSLTGLARFLRLQNSLGLSVESLVGVLDHVPVRPMKAGAKSLADQIGIAALTGPGGFPLTFHHAYFNASDPHDAVVDAHLPALLSVAGVAESDLLGLFKQYPAAFAFNAQGNCQLTADNIALLYAHVTLARAFRLSPGDLSLIVLKLFAIPGNDFRSLDLVEQLQKSVNAIQQLSMSVTDAFALIDPTTLSMTADQIVPMVATAQQSVVLSFGTSLLTSLPDISTQDADSIFASMKSAGLIDTAGSQFTLTAAYTPATDLGPSLPAAYVGRKAEIHAGFMAFHFVNLLPNLVAATVGMTVDKTLIALAFAQPGWDGAPVLKAFQTPITDGIATQPADLAPLLSVINDLARLAQLFSRLQLETADSWLIAQYPSLFGIQDIRQLRIADLEAIQRYRQLLSSGAFTANELRNLIWQYQVRANGNQPIAPAAVFSAAIATLPVFFQALASPDRAALTPAAPPTFPSQALLASPLNADEIELIATRRNLDPLLLRSIFLTQKLPSSALDGIARAIELYSFCNLVGIQGYSLGKLLARDFAGLGDAAQFLERLLENKYPDPAARDKSFSPHTGALNMLTRDALCAYIIARSDTLKFNSRDDLYSYFLIDVEMSGCFQTSRLVAALSSLQLYVHRCLIDLEQSQKDNLSVLSLIDPAEISQEWDWRQNYRVWEANRKVFLYPENYIEPELRDNKTPLFQDLEDNLLQRKITLDAAEEAYREYLVGFSTLAQLKVVGVYFDSDNTHPENNCYWFLARTGSDPYQYYLRRYFPAVSRWEPWESIELGISAPYVSPLVHLGRLYLFWVEITSMDQTSFVDGNSIFQGVAHQVKLHYSYRDHSGKWAPAQKKTLIDQLKDRAFYDKTPPFIKDMTGFTSLAVDKVKTADRVDYYRNSKTYAKVIATETGEPEKLTIHYFRHFEDTLVLEEEPSNPLKFNPIEDSALDRLYIMPTPGYQVRVYPNPAESVEYFRATLDLISNELSGLSFAPQDTVPARDGSFVPIRNTNSEDQFYDASNGTDAIGILYTGDSNHPNPSDYYSLMLRNYALLTNPAATDDMLVSQYQEQESGGTILSNSISAGTAHDMIPVNNQQQETVLQHWVHQHWIKFATGRFAIFGPSRVAVRVNTTLDGFLSQELFVSGLDQFLTLNTQSAQGEMPLGFDTNHSSELGFEFDPWGRLPYAGSFGDYYRELFFHTPFLVANQLNADGRYQDAKYWYEKIFNPTAAINPASPGNADGISRVWQYLEFQNVNVPKLKELLSDQATIDLYQHDPFNPHAIARLRLSAYQKTIVMKYVSNLIDWADELFTQDTMESVNEATMLYVLAADILGPRPVSVGKCEAADENTLTYDTLGPAMHNGSEFLMFVENIYIQADLEAAVKATLPRANADTKAPTMSASLRSTGLGSPRKYQRKPTLPNYKSASASKTQKKRSPRQPHITRQYLPAFCVPANDVLLGYWDRIDDRLFKIRNCLNIQGERVSLALFQPPIDPMLLVRAKAAGLSIEDIVGQQNEALPAYRFSYLLEKARQYAGTVQSFGSALLSALEKKDGEELALLRSTHEQNLLKLQRSMKQHQIDEAQAQLDSLRSQQQNVQNRVDYYSGLISVGLSGGEISEQLLRDFATFNRRQEVEHHIAAAITYLIPEAGSPFALTYGGKELGASLGEFGQSISALATYSEAAAGSAGLEATFQRRAQEWQQQLTLAQEEMNQVTKQVTAADIRVQIATKDLDVHEKQIEQAQEIYDFYRQKFSGTGLYTFLSTQLTRIHREAYRMAAQVGRQAERAYQFERDATDFFIQGDNWQSGQSGLLAGERLLLQLQRLEKAFMESNTREIEVSQSFSLLQINPGALQDLQQTGKCSFKLDEVWFDMQYPGHYRRLLKSVRLTVPCVVGPYTNVGAKLQLTNSWVRRKTGQSLLESVPPTMTSTIATSHAQNDAGVFELNFRDERYLPFEGAGAISEWSLDLPSKIRMFDYGSISDVVINLSYLVRYDSTLADEDKIIDAVRSYSQPPSGGLFRLISLRREFPDAFTQLLNPPVGQPQQTTFTLESRHFPAWLDGMALQPTTTQIVVWPRPAKGRTIDVSTLSLKIAGIVVGNWGPDGRGSANVAGSPIRSWIIDAGVNGFDKTKLDDLQLLVKYALQ